MESLSKENEATNERSGEVKVKAILSDKDELQQNLDGQRIPPPPPTIDGQLSAINVPLDQRGHGWTPIEMWAKRRGYKWIAIGDLKKKKEWTWIPIERE